MEELSTGYSLTMEEIVELILNDRERDGRRALMELRTLCGSMSASIAIICRAMLSSESDDDSVGLKATYLRQLILR